MNNNHIQEVQQLTFTHYSDPVVRVQAERDVNGGYLVADYKRLASQEYVNTRTITGSATLAPENWAQGSSPYSAQGFHVRYALTVSGVTTSHIPTVAFTPEDQFSGNYGIVESYAGGIYIYAKAVPMFAVSISYTCVGG